MRIREIPGLFKEKNDCCGCGACAAKCPKNAIYMEPDGYGYVFPRINESLCVSCGACERACGFQHRLGEKSAGPFYAASGRGDVSRSASGGAFASLARGFFDEGGVVFGAAYYLGGSGLHVRHRVASDEGGLALLQNSKYVQSDAASCFNEVLTELKSGRPVLFCGTPCQVAGLRGFLGRDWANLYTADLVCHGVPSEAMFCGRLDELGAKLGSRVVDVLFRSKRHGWGHSLLLLRLEDGREVEVPSCDDPYYEMFLRLKTLRESCYACPYACSLRAGDITLGDFWGIEASRPDVVEDARFDVKKGVSCLLVNNDHGRELLGRFKGRLDLFEVAFEDIAVGNSQLRHPSKRPSDRKAYLDAFAVGGWDEMCKVYRKRERGMGWKAKKAIRRVLPKEIILFAKRFLK